MFSKRHIDFIERNQTPGTIIILSWRTFGKIIIEILVGVYESMHEAVLVIIICK